MVKSNEDESSRSNAKQKKEHTQLRQRSFLKKLRSSRPWKSSSTPTSRKHLPLSAAELLRTTILTNAGIFCLFGETSSDKKGTLLTSLEQLRGKLYEWRFSKESDLWQEKIISTKKHAERWTTSSECSREAYSRRPWWHGGRIPTRIVYKVWWIWRRPMQILWSQTTKECQTLFVRSMKELSESSSPKSWEAQTTLSSRWARFWRHWEWREKFFTKTCCTSDNEKLSENGTRELKWPDTCEKDQRSSEKNGTWRFLEHAGKPSERTTIATRDSWGS